MRDPWESVKDKVETLLELSANWDSYGAEPIEQETVDNAKTIIEILRNLAAAPGLTASTSEGSVVINSHLEETELTLEIDSTDEVGVAVKRQSVAPIYGDIEIDCLAKFICNNLNATR